MRMKILIAIVTQVSLWIPVIRTLRSFLWRPPIATFWFLAMKIEDLLFPDFDDIAAPPEANYDFDRWKVAEQHQVSTRCPTVEKFGEKCWKFGCLSCLWIKSQFFSIYFYPSWSNGALQPIDPDKYFYQWLCLQGVSYLEFLWRLR